MKKEGYNLAAEGEEQAEEEEGQSCAKRRQKRMIEELNGMAKMEMKLEMWTELGMTQVRLLMNIVVKTVLR